MMQIEDWHIALAIALIIVAIRLTNLYFNFVRHRASSKSGRELARPPVSNDASQRPFTLTNHVTIITGPYDPTRRRSAHNNPHMVRPNGNDTGGRTRRRRADVAEGRRDVVLTARERAYRYAKLTAQPPGAPFGWPRIDKVPRKRGRAGHRQKGKRQRDRAQ